MDEPPPTADYCFTRGPSSWLGAATGAWPEHWQSLLFGLDSLQGVTQARAVFGLLRANELAEPDAAPEAPHDKRAHLELKELDLASSVDERGRIGDLAREIEHYSRSEGNGGQAAKRFERAQCRKWDRCRCRSLSVDRQRAEAVDRRWRWTGSRRAEAAAADDDDDDEQHEYMAAALDEALELLSGVKLTRSQLARRLGLRGRQSEHGLYLLERLVAELQHDLAKCLVHLRRQSERRLALISSQENPSSQPRDAIGASHGSTVRWKACVASGNDDDDDDENEDDDDENALQPMIRAPVHWDESCQFRELLAEAKMARRRCRQLREAPEESADSGYSCDDADEAVGGLCGAGLLQVQRWVACRGSAPMAELVERSAELLATFLHQSPLFAFFRPQQGAAERPLMSQQALRLFACVECQKLRSSVRFGWLAECRLAIHKYAGRKSAWWAAQLDASRLLGALLREQFLAPAYERLYALLRDFCGRRADWRLSGQLGLRETRPADSGGSALEQPAPLLVGASQPHRELQETLGFVLGELARVCDALPEPAPAAAGEPDAPARFLRVLQVGDRLPAEYRAKIDALVAHGFARLTGEPRSWLAPEFAGCLRAINRIRSEPVPASLDSRHLSAGARIGQLELARGQLARLEEQRRIIAGNAARLRLQNFGLVRLDCGPMQEACLEALDKERCLLSRLVADDLQRLMHRVELQFDEIHLGVDLDVAVEDHLAERRQQRQQRQQQHQQHQQQREQEQELGPLNEPRPEAELDASGGWLEPGESCESCESPQSAEWRPSEELMTRLEGAAGSRQQQQAQLAALTSQGSLGPEGGAARRVPPAVECRLLVARYRYMEAVRRDELPLLVQDLEVALEGLVLLGEQEAGAAGQPEPLQWAAEAPGELILSARQLRPALAEALGKLAGTRARLVDSNSGRLLALARLVLELRLLVSGQAQRALASAETLDALQSAAAWAGQLELRARYLLTQTEVLALERSLLQEARLKDDNHSGDAAGFPATERAAAAAAALSLELPRSIAGLLRDWLQLAGLLADLWSLAERFETQQVKWLNSDLKRLHYGQLESHLAGLAREHSRLGARGARLAWPQSAAGRAQADLFRENLAAVAGSLAKFSDRKLPLLELLSRGHLSEGQWAELCALIGPKARACTTLGQFLELRLDQQVQQVRAMSRRARVDAEISEFLAAELAAGSRSGRRRGQSGRLWFQGWSGAELELAAVRYLAGRAGRRAPEWLAECTQLARSLLAARACLRDFLRVVQQQSLELAWPRRAGSPRAKGARGGELVLRAPPKITSWRQLDSAASLFALLRLAYDGWSAARARLEARIGRLERSRASLDAHLADFERLRGDARHLMRSELAQVSAETEEALERLERRSAHLELEREILATKEALAAERQQAALETRDHCIRQITERAIPALRAAARALDQLDGRSLRSLIVLRPAPPEPVRLCLEAVCLLRARCPPPQPPPEVGGGQPGPLRAERRFDALSGRLHADYWPAACRMLNGTHSSRFVADLRRLHQRPMPAELMRLIRSRYLSRPKFRELLRAAQRHGSSVAPRLVARECLALASWLAAVDVFERVINVVRPQYRAYLEAERRLAGLLDELNNRRRDIELVAGELRAMEDSLETRLGYKMSLADCLDQCQQQLERARGTHRELAARRSACVAKLERNKDRRRTLAASCARQATSYLYLGALGQPERAHAARLLQFSRGHSSGGAASHAETPRPAVPATAPS